MKHKEEPMLDTSLIRRWHAGDQDAFDQLFERYKNLVFHTAFLILNNTHDAEDIMQDVFVQVHRSLNSYDPAKGALSTWLHRITVNKCLNHQRHWLFSVTRLDEIPEQKLFVVDDQNIDLDSVQQALSKLSVKLRAVVVLRFYWELSYAEMSEVLNLPLGTIKSRLNYALRALQTNLKDEFDPAIYSNERDAK